MAFSPAQFSNFLSLAGANMILISLEANKNKKLENQLKKKEHLESFVNRFRAKASKAKQAQSKMKQLDKLDIRDDYVSEEYL